MSSKEYFNQVAEKWDNMRQNFFSEEVRKAAYQVAGITEGKIAADIGAGTGFITEGLIAKGLKVIAVDQSEEMLNEMKRKFSGSNLVSYCMGESTSLPIDDNSVDFTFANMYIHHVESPASAVKEMVRILKSGGRLVMTDLDEHNFDFLKIEHQDRWMGFKRSDIQQWLLEAGLKNVRVDCVGQNCCTESCGNNEKAVISIFIASGEK